jgi:hypothetical protein
MSHIHVQTSAPNPRLNQGTDKPVHTSNPSHSPIHFPTEKPIQKPTWEPTHPHPFTTPVRSRRTTQTRCRLPTQALSPPTCPRWTRGSPRTHAHLQAPHPGAEPGDKFLPPVAEPSPPTSPRSTPQKLLSAQSARALNSGVHTGGLRTRKCVWP